MATYTRYCSLTNSGNVRADSALASAVEDGAASKAANQASTSALHYGYFVDGDYACAQPFLEFDLSGIAGTILSVQFQVYPTAVISSDSMGRLGEVREYDYGGSISTGDYLDRTSYAALTRLANCAWNPTLESADTWATFDDEALAGWIAANGDTIPLRVVLGTNKFATGTDPSDGACIHLDITGAVRPRIVIVTDAPVTLTTTLDAALMLRRAATTSLGAAVLQARSANATVAAALLVRREASAAIDAALRQAHAATAAVDAVLRAGHTTGATLDAAVIIARIATGTLDAAVAKRAQATATLDAALRQAHTATATLDSLVIAKRTAAAGVDAVLLKARTSTVSLDAVLEGIGHFQAFSTLDALLLAHRTTSAGLDAALLVGHTREATVDAALRQARAATATLTGALLLRRSAGSTLDAALRVPRTAVVGLDAALRQARAATASLGAALRTARQATASVDAAVQVQRGLAASLDAALLQARGVTATLDGAVLGPRSVASLLEAALQHSHSVATVVSAALVHRLDLAATLDALLAVRRERAVTLDAYLVPGRTPWETDEDLDVFFDPDDGALEAIYVTAGGVTATLYGWHENPVQQFAVPQSEVDTYAPEPSFTCSARRLPRTAAAGDWMTVETDTGRKEYRVRGLRPDGTGVVWIDLEQG